MHTLVTDLHPDYYPSESPYSSTRVDTDRLPMLAYFDIDETISGAVSQVGLLRGPGRGGSGPGAHHL